MEQNEFYWEKNLFCNLKLLGRASVQMVVGASNLFIHVHEQEWMPVCVNHHLLNLQCAVGTATANVISML